MAWPKGRPGVKQRTHPVRDDFFHDLSGEESAYFYGLFCADGYISSANKRRVGIDLNEKDQQLLAHFATALGYAGDIKRTSHGMCRLIWTSAGMRDRLHSYGIRPDKSTTLPSMKDVVPDASVRHFVRGLTDGDGSWSWCSNGQNRKYLNYQLRSTPVMCQWLKSVFPSEVNYTENKTGLLYTKRKSSVEAIGGWLYEGASVYLLRKKQTFETRVSGTSG